MEERRFTTKMLENEQMLYRIACAFLRSEHDRQDAMQETALKAWQYRDRLREEQYFKTWITRIMVNECRMIIRKSKRMIVTDYVLMATRTLDKPVTLKTAPAQFLPAENNDMTEYPYELIELEGFTLEECMRFFQAE